MAKGTDRQTDRSDKRVLPRDKAVRHFFFSFFWLSIPTHIISERSTIIIVMIMTTTAANYH